MWSKFLIFFLASFLVAGANADSRWVKIAESSDGSLSWHARVGSFEIERNAAGEAKAAIIGRQNADGRVIVERWKITLEDCSNEFGKLRFYSLDNRFKFSADIAFGAGSMAGVTAEVLCREAAFHSGE